MSSIVTAAPRHRRYLFASSLLIPLALSSVPAHAQQAAATDQLPAIQINAPKPVERNRTEPSPEWASRLGRVTRIPAPQPAPVAQPSPPAAQPSAPVTTAGSGGPTTPAILAGTATTVITSAEIARSPAQTVQEIIAQVPGVQLTTLYGGVNGARTSVDLRGFGALATANTLVLINGRRLNDIDLAGVDLSTLPRDAIERIEITKGNSGAVLYGDNAVGGVVNIVTRTGVGGPPLAARIETGIGSFNQRQVSASASANSGPWSTSFHGIQLNSDGYRVNNTLAQHNAIGDVRYTTPDLTAYLTLSGDDQRLGLPGGRLVDPSIGVNQLVTDRKGAATPFDHAEQQGANATAGFVKSLGYGAELIVDGGVRDKKQQGTFLGQVPLQSLLSSYVDAKLQTWSLTPRLSIKNTVLDMPSNILTGIDYYDATFHQNRGAFNGAPPIHMYDLSQRTVAAYWQQTVSVLPSTDVSYGGRVQHLSLAARDALDPTAPNYFGDAQALPLDTGETHHAFHLGIEHRFNDVFAVFGRAAQAFRTPNADERVSPGPSFDPVTFAPIAQNFALKTQSSNDVEGGFRIKAGAFAMQSSIYDMELTNELQFNPVGFFNVNLGPTRRYGSETSATFRATDTLLFRGGVAMTRAIFREGPFAGNDVPLVSRYTASGGVTWNAWQNYLVVDATVRAWSSRRMDNDQPNTQPPIPANATVDLKLSGEYQRFFWSLSVNNIFNVLYYDYAIASAFTADRFNAYPLPGRTFLLKAGATF
ncbi:MAG TPA: TonB-dependent receptor [Bradyrhizobium sp.]|nr:TonB-dependent receptor [Bradyrhizobium sp.]